MYRDLKAQLKSLKHNAVFPAPAWLERNRALLLSQIRNTVNEPSKSFPINNFWNGLSMVMPRTLVFNVVRPVAVLLVVSIVATSGWVASVDAAYNTLPGDWLYPAKRVAEKTQITVAAIMGAKNTEVKLHSEFAKRRATETKQIINGTDPKKQERVAQSVIDLKKEIVNVNTSLDAINVAKADQASAAIVKDVKQDTEQVKDVLQEVKTNLITSTSTADKSVSVAVSEAKDMAKDTAVKAVEVMVSKHLNGDNSVSQEEVKQVINATAQSALVEAAENKQNMAGVKIVMDAVKTEVKEAAVESAKSSSVISSSTKAFADQVSSVSEKTNEATIQSAAAVTETTKKAEEVKTLVQQGDLVKAIEKIKEVTETTKASEKISDSVIKSVQNVLPPVVEVVKEKIVPVVAADSKIDPKNIAVIVTTTNAVAVPPIVVLVTSTPEKK